MGTTILPLGRLDPGRPRPLHHLDAELLSRRFGEHGAGVVGAQPEQQVTTRHADVDQDVAKPITQHVATPVATTEHFG